MKNIQSKEIKLSAIMYITIWFCCFSLKMKFREINFFYGIRWGNFFCILEGTLGSLRHSSFQVLGFWHLWQLFQGYNIFFFLVLIFRLLVTAQSCGDFRKIQKMFKIFSFFFLLKPIQPKMCFGHFLSQIYF